MIKHIIVAAALLGCTLGGAAAGMAENQRAETIPVTSLTQESATEKSDSMAEEYNTQGLYYARQQSYGAALQSFSKARSLAQSQRNMAIYTNNLAMTYKLIGKYDVALDTVNMALDAAPDMVDALDTKGDILLSLKRYDEAESYLTHAILLNPDTGTSYYNRGRAYEGMGDRDRALADYKQAVSLPGAYQKEAKAALQRMKTEDTNKNIYTF